jgi:hypothetical protein
MFFNAIASRCTNYGKMVIDNRYTKVCKVLQGFYSLIYMEGVEYACVLMPSHIHYMGCLPKFFFFFLCNGVILIGLSPKKKYFKKKRKTCEALPK